MCTAHPKKGDLTIFEGLTAEQEEDCERACRAQLGSTLHYNKARHVCFSEQLLLLADPTFRRPRPAVQKRGRPPKARPQPQVARPTQPAQPPQNAESEEEAEEEEEGTRCLEDLAAFFNHSSEDEDE